MAVTTGTVATGTATTGLTCTASLAISAGQSLIVLVGNEATAPPLPSGVTYNGVAMTLIGHKTDVAGGGIYDASIWWLGNPSVGTFNVVSTSTNSIVAAGVCGVPIIGADAAHTPAIGTGATGNSTAAACTISGAGASDIQVAAAFCSVTAIAAAGAPQVNLATLNSIHALSAFSGDAIPGTSAGNFGWTLTPSGVWACIAATVFAPVAGGGAAMTGPIGSGITHPIGQLITGLPI